MAGIGFEIRKLMDEQTFTSDFKAYFFAGVVSSGPWVVSIISSFFLWFFSASFFGIEVLKLFRVVIVYTYAYSLILTGLIQFALNRFLSDKLYLKQRNVFLPTYISIMLFTMIFQGFIAVIFYGLNQVDFYFKITGVVLFIAVSCIWQTMIFLTASKDYVSIVGAFFWGNIAGIFLAVILGPRSGFNGYLLGYTIGQVATFFFLVHRVFLEFYSTVSFNFEFFMYLKKYYKLLLIGTFYYLAIWVDKLIYWYSPAGEHNKAFFYSHFPYDSCMFLAFLAIIPALAHFMVDVETNFYEKYKGFYGSIVNKSTLRIIEKSKQAILKVLFESSSRMIMLQTVVSLAFICYSPVLIRLLHLRQEHLIVLWMGGIGTYFHVFVLISMILILYFDRQKAALSLAIFFLMTNTIFTLLVIRFAPHLMGLGYACSTALSAVFGIRLLYVNIKNIEFLTFVYQPLLKPKLPKVASLNPRIK
jgi:uncharacterized membrane protein